MDINTKINIISSIIIPLFGMLGGVIGFYIGIFKERNDTKWKENREAIQCAYACCEELKRSVNKNIPLNINLIENLKNKWFNIKDKKTRDKIFNIIETGIIDSTTGSYLKDKAIELVKQIDNILPLLLKELK